MQPSIKLPHQRFVRIGRWSRFFIIGVINILGGDLATSSSSGDRAVSSSSGDRATSSSSGDRAACSRSSQSVCASIHHVAHQLIGVSIRDETLHLLVPRHVRCHADAQRNVTRYPVHIVTVRRKLCGVKPTLQVKHGAVRVVAQ